MNELITKYYEIKEQLDQLKIENHLVRDIFIRHIKK